MAERAIGVAHLFRSPLALNKICISWLKNANRTDYRTGTVWCTILLRARELIF